MKNLVIEDLNKLVELSAEETAAIQGGLDNKPTAPKPLGSELVQSLDNTIGLPVPGTWLGPSDFIRS